MDPMRRTALVAGVLYLVTFVIGIPPALLLQPVLGDPGYIVSAGADGQVLLGASFDIINALACIGTAVALFSVVRREHEGMALGFVTTRLMEGAVIVVGAVAILAVVTLRQPEASGVEATSLVTVGSALVAIRDWTFLLGPGLMPALNALLLGTLLYRSGLVPRWMPTLGLIGAPMLLSSTVGTFFGVNEVMSPWTGIATVPIFVWELSIGLYMTVKGFRATAPLLATRPTGTAPRITAQAGAA